LALLGTIVIAVAIGAAFTSLLILAQCESSKRPGVVCDLANWQSLLLEGLTLGAGLGSFFYYLQRKDTRKTETLVKEIGAYVEENRKLISTIKRGYLYSVQTMLQTANTQYKREKTIIGQVKDPLDRDRSVFMYVNATRNVDTNHADQIESHMNFLKAYVDPAMIDEIKNSVSRIRHLCEEPKIPAFADVDSWLSFLDHTIQENAKVIEKLEILINENKT